MNTDDRENSLAEKKELILNQALEIFALYGYQNADVQKIADRCGVGKGTVYRYFLSKENLFNEAGNLVIQKLDQILKDVLDSSLGPLEKIEEHFIQTTRFFEKNKSYLSVLTQIRFMPEGAFSSAVNERLKSQFYEAVCDILQEGIDQGFILPGNPMSYLISMVNAILGVTAFYKEEEDPLPLMDRVRTTLRIFYSGIMTPEARQKWPLLHPSPQTGQP